MVGERATLVCDVQHLGHEGSVSVACHNDGNDRRFENPTVERAVDGCLTCILGREAAARHRRLTMDGLLKENNRLEADLTGLRA